MRLILARAFRRCSAVVKPLFFADGMALVEHGGSTTSRPKLIVLDLQMPILDGLTALKMLQRSHTLADTPMIIFSASSEDPETVRAAYAAGAALYLKKPHRLEEFNDMARLCVSCFDKAPAVTRSVATLGALDVKRAVRLLCEAHENSALPQRL